MKTIRFLLLAVPLVLLLGCGDSTEPARPDAADKITASEGTPCGRKSACSSAQGCESACVATACGGHQAMSQGELLNELEACCETAQAAGCSGSSRGCPGTCPDHDGQPCEGDCAGCDSKACAGTCPGHDGKACAGTCPGHDGQACTGDCTGCAVENCAARQTDGCSQACARHKS